jgi:hypothetical protein
VEEKKQARARATFRQLIRMEITRQRNTGSEDRNLMYKLVQRQRNTSCHNRDELKVDGNIYTKGKRRWRKARGGHLHQKCTPMLINGSEIPTLNTDNDVQCTGDKNPPHISVFFSAFSPCLLVKKHTLFLVFFSRAWE